MEQDKICLASKTIELSESNSYIELANRLCYYDEPNANGVVLPSDTAEEYAQTLVTMPVVARYRVNAQGQPDLGGHECYVNPVTKEVEFRTENIGTHVSVEVKDDVVEINGQKKVLKCLFATCRIWKRNKNVVAAVQRLFTEGRLFSSWEILSKEFNFKDGLKTITNYEFEANCLLGSGHEPAYGSTACAIAMASEDPETIIASALAADVSEREDTMEDFEVVVNESETSETVEPEIDNASDIEVTIPDVSEAETSETVSEEEVAENTEEQSDDSADEPEVEVSALTARDIRNKLFEVLNKKFNCYCDIVFVFPEEHVVWFKPDNERLLETEFKEATYAIENDNVAVGEPVSVKLLVGVREINQAIAERDSALVSANEKINELQATVEKLTPYMEECVKAENEKKEKAKAECKKRLKGNLERSGLFTEAELNGEEIVSAVENLDEASVNAIIAKKFLESIQKPEEVTSEKKQGNENESVDASCIDDGEASYADFMKAFLKFAK